MDGHRVVENTNVSGRVRPVVWLKFNDIAQFLISFPKLF